MAPPRCEPPREEPDRPCIACGARAVYDRLCAACDADPAPFGPWDDDSADEWDDLDPLGRECCWHCHGMGGWHDCGEDCCPCADPDLNETCPECGGTGWL